MKNVLISATLSATLGLSAFSSLAQDVDLRILVGATAAIRSPSRRWRNSTNKTQTSTSKQNTPVGTAIFHA